MIINGLDTDVAAAQLRLLFDIRAIFVRKGRKVASFQNPEDLLFDSRPYNAPEKYYPVFNSSVFRRVLRLIANSKDGQTVNELKLEHSDLTEKQIQEVLKESVELKLIALKDGKYIPSRPVGFGSTFEWYVAQICMQELASLAYWGVKVENLTGDYDVVVIRENQIGYIECKSGRMSNIVRDDIKNFLERERILAPQFSIFLVDGVSKENMKKLVDFALEQKLEYEFEIPGVMNTEVSLEAEEYKNFIRLIPINSFFITADRPIASSIREIYEFLTLVCDRALPTENTAAKAQFSLTKEKKPDA